MPDFSFGSTFQPGGGDEYMRRRQQGQQPQSTGFGASTSPIQQAVQVLSLRLPEVFSPSAPIARSLASGGMQSHIGPTQSSAVARSIVANATGRPTAPPISAPPPIRAGGALPPTGGVTPQRPTRAGYRVPSMPVNVPSEVQQLVNIISNLPHLGGQNPLISMGVRPGGVPQFPTSIPSQLPQVPPTSVFSNPAFSFIRR